MAYSRLSWPGRSFGSTTDGIDVAQSNLGYRLRFDVEHPVVAWNVASATEADRDALIRFWLAAPADLLPGLWQGTPGESTKTLVQQLTPSTSFSAEQVKLRDELGAQLSQLGLQHPSAPQLLLATFLLSPAGLFQVASPEQNLPQWLLPAYQELYEQPAASQPQVAAPEPVEARDVAARVRVLEAVLGRVRRFRVQVEDPHAARVVGGLEQPVLLVAVVRDG